MSNWRSTAWPARDQLVNILDKCWAAQVLISLLLFSAVFSKGVANANVDPVSHRFWEHLGENFLCGLSSVQCVHPTGTANVHSGAKNWHCQLQFHPQNQGEHCVGGNSVSLRRMLIGYDDPISNKPGLECYCPPPSWSRFAELHHRFTPGLTRCLLSRVEM